MAHLLDSGALEALTPDDTGILREWAMKYAVITDAQTSQAALSIYSSPTDIEEPEVVITINGSDVQVSRQPNFERCFTVTTENGLRIFLRAASVAERDSWVESIRRAKRAATPPKKDGRTMRSPAVAQAPSSIARRCCGYVFLWDEASQSWVDRYFYLSSGFLHGLVSPFTMPAISFDLSRDCAIRMRGTPPCAEVRLGTGEIVRFTGKNETETAEWVMGIKARSAEPPQPFQGFDRACADASRFEGDEGSLSFYLKPETIPEAMAGAPAAFLLIGSMGHSGPLAHEFTAVLTPEENDGKVLAKGSFTPTSDGKYLNLRILYHKQGKYSLWVRYRDRSIFGSPFRFTVHAGPPSATHSIVSGSGIVYAPLARKVGKFVIRMRDKFLNFCEHVDGSQLQVRMFGPAAILNITQLDPCAFEVAYRTTSQASLIQIEIGYANVPIAGSPFSPTFEEPSFNSADARDEEEAVLDRAIGVGQQSQAMVHLDPESKAMDEAVQADLEAARTAKQVAAKAEAVSAFLSSKIRQDWAENNDQIDNVFEKNEQLELLLASSSLRANDDEPAFLRSYAVEVETGAGSIRKWEPEPHPPPWAPLSVVQAHVRHVRRDLQEAIHPLIDAVRAETSTGRRLEPVSLWKKLLLDWPGPDKATKEHISALRVAISTSPLHHRQLISAMCEAVLRAEEDLHARRKMHGLSGEAEQQIEDEPQEAEDAPVAKLEDDHSESRSLSIYTTARKEIKDPREELRKRVQSMSLGRNTHRPFEPMYLTAERPAKEKPSGERMKRLISNETDDDDENDEEEEEGGDEYDQVEDVYEEKEPIYQHETKDERPSVTTTTTARLGRRHSSGEESHRAVSSSSTRGAPRPSIVADSPVKTERVFQIGDRVTVDGAKKGVVRHVGPTRFAPGLWVGVELDDKLGKNAGSVDGVQYFACAPLHGLFVRPDRVEELQEGNEPRLGPGSLSHIDATELIQAFRLRQDEEGRLKMHDFTAALRSLDPNIPTSAAESLFQAFDLDESGELDAREFVPGSLVLCGGEGDEKIQMAFKLLDVDRSGYLDKQELQLYAESVFRLVAHSHPEIFQANNIDPQTLAEESIRSAFEYCDRDSDGRMSLDEFRKWMHTFGSSGTSSRQAKETTNSRRPSGAIGTPLQQQRQPTAAAREFASTPQRSPPTREVHGTPTSSVSRTPVVVSALKPNQKSAAQIAADWAEVERWLTEEAAITVPFEQKATLDQFKENGFITLIRVSRLTAADINRLNLSFDLRLRLVTKVRELAKKLVFEASERRINLSPLAGS